MHLILNESDSDEPPSDKNTISTNKLSKKRISYSTFKFRKEFYGSLQSKKETNTILSQTTTNLSSLEFKNKYYSDVSISERNDRKRQLKNTIFSLDKLQNILKLTDDELKIFISNPNTNFRITPYYLSLIDPNNISDPIRKTIIPNFQETIVSQ